MLKGLFVLYRWLGVRTEGRGLPLLMGVLVLSVLLFLLLLLDRLLLDRLVLVDLLLPSRWPLLLLLPRLRPDRLAVDLRLLSRFDEEALLERLLRRSFRGVDGERVDALSVEEEDATASLVRVRDDRVVFREARFRRWQGS